MRSYLKLAAAVTGNENGRHHQTKLMQQIMISYLINYHLLCHFHYHYFHPQFHYHPSAFYFDHRIADNHRLSPALAQLHLLFFCTELKHICSVLFAESRQVRFLFQLEAW